MAIFHVSVYFPLISSQSYQYALQYILEHNLTIIADATSGDGNPAKRMRVTLPSELNRYYRKINKWAARVDTALSQTDMITKFYVRGGIQEVEIERIMEVSNPKFISPRYVFVCKLYFEAMLTIPSI